MDDDFFAAMNRATAATRASNLTEATRIIREALGLRGGAAAEATAAGPARRPRIDTNAEIVEPLADARREPARDGLARLAGRLRRPLREVIRTLREGKRAAGLAPAPTGLAPLAPKVRAPLPEGARFDEHRFACAAGARDYKLYVPARTWQAIRGLVVMLHGCKQDPDDFALGTDMNRIAEAEGLVVAYPRQTSADNLSSCWNWFRPGDQVRDAGEPAILAGITRELIAEFAIKPGRVYVAGLSAGGAMAAVLAETYPDLFAAAGIHSGLPTGAANDVLSAFAAMRGDPGPGTTTPRATAGRTIIFHGAADRTVHPSNADRMLAGHPEPARREQGSAGGRDYTRAIVEGPGAARTELWLVDGAGHAWSGGNSGGSYADPAGPDASAEMVRFFLSEV